MIAHHNDPAAGRGGRQHDVWLTGLRRLVDDDAVEAHRAKYVGRFALQHRRVKIRLRERGDCGQLALAWWHFKGVALCIAMKGNAMPISQVFSYPHLELRSGRTRRYNDSAVTKDVNLLDFIRFVEVFLTL